MCQVLCPYLACMSQANSGEPPRKRQRTDSPTLHTFSERPSFSSSKIAKGKGRATESVSIEPLPKRRPSKASAGKSQEHINVTTGSESESESESDTVSESEDGASGTNDEEKPNQLRPVGRNPKVREYRRRKFNVYAAVAGRIHSTREKSSHYLGANQPLTPADALLSSASAPVRYEHPLFDFYGAHRWIGQLTRGDVYREGYELEEIKRWTGGTGEVPRVADDQGGNFEKEISGGRAQKQSFLRSNPTSSDARKLPRSDLLKAIHRYASVYYAAVQASSNHSGCGNASRTRSVEKSIGKQASSFDYHSMDETALLAMGILLEETCREYV